MGVEKVRRRFAVRGSLVFGAAGDAGFQRKSANTIETLSGDILDLADRELRGGTISAALGTTSNLPTTKAGLIRLGFSAGTAQLGFVLNGTSYVMEGTTGGAVTMRVNPAGV